MLKHSWKTRGRDYINNMIIGRKQKWHQLETVDIIVHLRIVTRDDHHMNLDPAIKYALVNSF